MAVVAVTAVSGQTAKLFVDADRAELIRMEPELNVLAFDSDQTSLDPMLRAVGQQLKSMFAKFVNVSIAEEIHEMRFESARLTWTDRRERFRYVARVSPFSELRKRVEDGQAPNPLLSTSYLAAGRFIEMLNDLLPEKQNDSRFRYLGHSNEGGRRTFVIAFAARDETRQGLIWVDEPTKTIVRLRTYILRRQPGESFESFTKDVRFVPVNFAALETAPWLPVAATVQVRFAAGELYSIHRFSDYRVEGFEGDTDAAQLKEDTGEAPTQAGVTGEDAIETLLKGVAALQANKTGDAVIPLREAAARLPERFEPQYYLGLALHGTHDLAGAETQLRGCLKRKPDFAPAHNELGLVLFEGGDAAGALSEFQQALRLQPGDATVLANIAVATKKLESANIGAPAALPAPTRETTIKVDVRQVLVPVVVTDKEGHHVTGLTLADFRVLEDGMEQKISAFATERADLLKPAVGDLADAQHPNSPAATAPTPLTARHAYVICVDALHASFGNFVHVREALQKLFQQEEAGDSQYVVIALGRAMEIVQNTTSDPKQVLEALGASSFRKTFLSSQKSSSEYELTLFERTLQEVRALCDSSDPILRNECESRKPTLPFQADQVSESARLNTIQFLAQLRSVVGQLAAGRGRRTVVLISDGFSLMPGRAAYGLLAAYFPDLTRNLRGFERMQDAMDPVFKLAAKGNVPIYTIDSRGLYTSPSLDASRGGVGSHVAPEVDRSLNDIATEDGFTLSEIAAATGGTAFQNSNDLLAGLKRAFADGREYYMLAYVPTNEAQDGKFRKIEVHVRDKKVIVNAKRGYWATQ